MANSFLNKAFKAVQKVSPQVSSLIVSVPASTYSIVNNITNWAVSTNNSSCVERPRPPVEEPTPSDPVEVPTPPSTPVPVDIEIPKDDRVPPGINSKTASVGKKVTMIDYHCFYSYNPNNELQTIPYSPQTDPVRFLLGRLWTQNPPDSLLGTNANLFGKSVVYGHRIVERREDWVQSSGKPISMFKDPEKITDINTGNAIEYDFSETNDHTPGRTSVVKPIEEGWERSTVETVFSSLYKDAGLTEVPIFSDLAEFGTIKLEMNPSTIKAESDLSAIEVYRRLIFGGAQDLSGNLVGSHTFKEKLEHSVIKNSGGLFSTIEAQQTSYGTYSDHSHEYNSPISSINLDHYAKLIKPKYARYTPVYNFYEESYEALHTPQYRDTLPEHTLPNIYTLMTEKYSEKRDYELSPSITNFLRLNSTLERRNLAGENKNDQIYNFMVDKLSNSGEKISEKSSGRSYFKKWSSSADRMIREGTYQVFDTTHSNYRNQAFPYEEDRLYLNVGITKSSFPMYIDIEFSTDTTAPMADAIASTRFDCYLTDYLINSPMNKDLIDVGEPGLHKSENYASFVEAQQFIISGSQSRTTRVVSRLFPNIVPTEENPSQATGRRCYDLEEWIRGLDEPNLDRTTKMFFGEAESLDISEKNNSELSSLFRVFLIGKIKKIIREEDKFRTMDQIYNGKLAYNETLMYKIEKCTLNAMGEEEIVSQYYIPNKSETDVVKFTDTQVKYERTYYYKIKAINLVIGNEYFYFFPKALAGLYGARQVAKIRATLAQKFDNSGVCTINYCNYPSVKIIESPYYNDEQDSLIISKVTDCPPVPPHVKLDVYKGRSNKVLITFNSGIGDYVDDPVILDSNYDERIIKRIRENQALQISSLEKNDLNPDKLSKVRFKNDDTISTFEIYRTDLPPFSYEDFDGRRIAAISTGRKYNSAAFIDTITPNAKYYYVFRAIDVHGYFSNPTMVYEIEMVKDQAMIYPIIRIYPPGEGFEEKEPSKPFQKFLEIKPLDEHKNLNFALSGLDFQKNMIPSEDSRQDALSSVFPYSRENFKEGSQYFLGDPENRQLVWGRKFKIRITSKKSARKLDLNVKFKYTDLVRAEDFYLNEE